MSFRLVPKSVTLNDLERRNGRYFALFQRIRVPSGAHCVKVQTDPTYRHAHRNMSYRSQGQSNYKHQSYMKRTKHTHRQ